MSEALQTLAGALRRLEGKPPSSVEFVQDYVQLRFDGPTLSAYNPLSIEVKESIVKCGDRCYHDFLCAQINHRVEETRVIEDKEVSLRFENGAILRISLREEDCRGPEALEFVSSPDHIWIA
jgi:hypothetical protein